jgi:hypothetical protein
MSSVADQLANSAIERWVKKVEFVSSANLEDIEGSASGVYTFNELVEVNKDGYAHKNQYPASQYKTLEPWQIPKYHCHRLQSYPQIEHD